jgi:environmental stress-induced protein Ves
VSVADVAQAASFSRFEGVDRALVLLEGAGTPLEKPGPETRTHALTQAFGIARFAGEASIDVRLLDGGDSVQLDAGDMLRVDTTDTRRAVHVETQGTGTLLAINFEEKMP